MEIYLYLAASIPNMDAYHSAEGRTMKGFRS